MTEQKIYNEDWQIGIKRIENNTIDNRELTETTKALCRLIRK